LAVILMSASLPNLELNPGKGQIAVMKGEEFESVGAASPNPYAFFMVRAFFLVLGVLIPLAIIFSLRVPEARWRLFLFLCVILVLFLLVNYIPWNRSPVSLTGIQMPGSVASMLPSSTGKEYIPHPPRWIVYAASFSLSALVLGLSLFLWLRWRRSQTSSLDLVAREAHKTIKELRAGADLKEGVIRCYYDMSRVLKEQHGLSRRHAMTTREFERYLEEAGLSGDHVRRLTRLFEKVRYGAKNLGEAEEGEAIDCLTAIIRSSEGSP